MKKSPTRFIRRVDNKFTSASLDLNFQNMTPSSFDSRITFTRASNATYFDGSGILQTASTNVPRLDHSPTTRLPLGLLIEEQRTNLILQSEDFSTTWAVTRSSVTTNAVVAPNGTLTGDTLVANTDNNTHFIRQGNFTFTSGVTYTFSVFVKAAGYSFVAVRGDSTSGVLGAAVYFSLTDGSVTQSASGVTTTSTAVGNGWYRLSVTATATSTESTGRPTVYLTNVGTGPSFGVSFVGNNSDGVYLWGAQLEAGAFPTSYIPTTVAAATRNADVASMTGTNFSSWYRADEGTFFVESLYPNPVTTGKTHQSILISQTSVGGVYDVRAFSTTVRYAVQGTNTAIGTGLIGNPNKVCFGYTQTGSASQSGSLNGAAAVSSTTSVSRTADTLEIGAGSTANALNGTIRKIAYWPVRLENAQLQALTR